MKRFLGCVLGGIVFAGASPAFAADLAAGYVVTSPPREIAQHFTWTGCYVGVEGGYGTGPFKWWDPADNGDAANFFGQGTQKGAIAGAEVGCNYEAPNHFVFGFEGDFAWSGLKGTFTPTNSDKADTGKSFHIETNWLSTAALRGGYAWDHTLFYLKGGLAAGGMKHTMFDPENPGSPSFWGDETRWGYVVGVGVEYEFANKWTIKGEYNFVDLGSRLINGLHLDGEELQKEQYRVQNSINLFKIGLNRYF